jgi:twinkle protein
MFDQIKGDDGRVWNLLKSWESIGVAQGAGRSSARCPLCSDHRKPENRSQKCLSINFEYNNAKCNNDGCNAYFKIGEKREERRHEQKKNYNLPKEKIKIDIPDNLLSFLLGTRKFTEEVVRRNKLGHSVKSFSRSGIKGPCISIPYFKDGAHIGTKYRLPDPKDWTAETGTEPIVYGYDDIKGDELFWVEGELDKLAVEVAGFKNCVSVPNGASSAGSLENIKAKLKSVKSHIIAVDNDGSGYRLKKDLIRRLNPGKCKTVSFPEGCKDANDVLIKHGPDALRQRLTDQTRVPIDGIIKPSSLIEKLKGLYYNQEEEGLSTGWPNVDRLYRVKTGQFTVITGIPNHGKSEFLDALAINMIVNHKWKIGVFSPENHPVEVHMRKLLKKLTGKPFGSGFNGSMGWEEASECTRRFDDVISFVGDMEEGHTVDSILEATEALVFSDGINGMIIDPWNAIEHSRSSHLSETEYLSKQLTRISQLVRKHDIHLWIVAHPTKLQKKNNGSYDPPLPYDISGSANWFNKPDNCLTVYIPYDEKYKENEVLILVNKIKFRENGRPGTASLFFNQTNGRYLIS